MNNILKRLEQDFELYLGSIFLSITSVIVIMNVFTRYFLKFTFTWAEEVAVGAFVWTIFLGFSSSYKKNELIGVEVLVAVLPEKIRNIVEVFTSIIITILSATMFYFSYIYVAGSTKITAALEVSYKYIYASIVLAFGLITLCSIYFLIQSIQKVFSNKKVKN